MENRIINKKSISIYNEVLLIVIINNNNLKIILNNILLFFLLLFIYNYLMDKNVY